jgi:ribosome-binding protein aMBF1 (putative translation factor)
MPTDDRITGAEARELSAKIEEIEGQINSLRAKLKKESQFNRKMELNIEIKRLEQNKNKLLGGDRV